jgi:site-specific DNA-methyltransferase (adenine-specific)
MREQVLTADSYLAGAAGLGRWPANLLHDGSDEIVSAFPSAPGQLAKASTSDTQRAGQNTFGVMNRDSSGAAPRGDAGSAARFFYTAKASKHDRNEGLEGLEGRLTDDGRKVPADNAYQRGKSSRQNFHPTVKPTDLMRYLCRLITPQGGVVLDPFMGSGSTLKAAELEGFSAIGIELDPQYIEIARRRIAGDMPLFADLA